jgi:DNA-binding NarL/FixJ family response regulator
MDLGLTRRAISRARSASCCRRRWRHADDYLRRGEAGQDDTAAVAVTAREREIIQLVAEGQSNKQAASTLGISVKTVEAHRSSIMKKLHLRSVSDLVRYAVRNRIVEP